MNKEDFIGVIETEIIKNSFFLTEQNYSRDLTGTINGVFRKSKQRFFKEEELNDLEVLHDFKMESLDWIKEYSAQISKEMDKRFMNALLWFPKRGFQNGQIEEVDTYFAEGFSKAAATSNAVKMYPHLLDIKHLEVVESDKEYFFAFGKEDMDSLSFRFGNIDLDAYFLNGEEGEKATLKKVEISVEYQARF